MEDARPDGIQLRTGSSGGDTLKFEISDSLLHTMETIIVSIVSSVVAMSVFVKAGGTSIYIGL